MECASHCNVNSYTRYRTAAVAAVHVAQERAGVESAALALMLAAFWGYVLYVVLQAAV